MLSSTSRILLRRLLRSSRSRFTQRQHRSGSTLPDSSTQSNAVTADVKRIRDGPPLAHFIANSTTKEHPTNEVNSLVNQVIEEPIPYLSYGIDTTHNRKVYFETYGCQMNVNDTEIAWGILENNGFTKTDDINKSDVILIMTCSVREGAEQKIWNRLVYLNFLKKKRRREKSGPPLKIGILGCMAERLKSKLVEQQSAVDLVCGPDAYRDLPRMLTLTESGQTAVNVLLSLDETYADISPVRLNVDNVSAFVSVMRGCDNMCSYCIVPFTRGRERSQPLQTVTSHVLALAQQGVKEVTLLGQNVNSYRDTSDSTAVLTSGELQMSSGFRTVYKRRSGGRRFAELLDAVSCVVPDVRIRFTSPHPKDFPDEVLYMIRDRPNICCQLHLPAQSGSSRVLETMRRGYTREAYLQLVDHIREIIPDISLSSDFIAGFCGETDEDHHETLSLIRRVRYNYAFSFPYSMRQKTRACHHLNDDVPTDVKMRRHREVADCLRQGALELNAEKVGQTQLVLVEKPSKRSKEKWAGRNEANIRVIIPAGSLPVDGDLESSRAIAPGDFVAVRITAASSQVLQGVPLYHTTLQQYAEKTSRHKNGIS